MKSKQINSILNEVLEKIKPSQTETKKMEAYLKIFVEKCRKKLEEQGINAEIFVGGSFAKKTVIKKDKYDIDVFIRFNKRYKDKEISKLTEKLVENIKEASLIHGSRDYFRIKITPDFFIELIPVKKIKKPEEAENITDLSYAHVKYINKKIKSKKLLDEIMLAKAFCYANHCYGAESYINGFSGYALELLGYYYKSFLKFIKAVEKIKDKKLIIDMEKHYKSDHRVLLDLNASKLQSPIILIDPTYKQRNALAALSKETLEKFKEDCIEFLKNPAPEDFEPKKTDLEKIKKDAKKKVFEFILVETSTDRQEGDIAGSKLLKFYKHLIYEIEKFFGIKDKGFNYNEKKSARYFFVVKNKGEILIGGPYIKDLENVKAFKKKHKNYFTKKGKIYSKKIIDFNLKEFIENWKLKNKNKIKEMDIESLEIIE